MECMRFVQKGHRIVQSGRIERCLGSFCFAMDCKRIVDLLNEQAEYIEQLEEENKLLKERLDGDDL